MTPQTSPILNRVRRRLRRGWEGYAGRLLQATRARHAAQELSRHRSPDSFLTRLAAISPYGANSLNQLSANITTADRALILQTASAGADQRFRFLGAEVSFSGRDIDWHTDFKSGYRWDPAQHYTRVPVYAPHPGADIKLPWELSRCQHLASLALACHLVDDPAPLAESYRSQITAWIQANPVDHGVNWRCPMDVAIRAVNWITGAWLILPWLRTAPASGPFLNHLALSLWHHGHHINRNLEWLGPADLNRGNHFISDLVGLLTIGAVLQDLPRGNHWFRRAHRLLQDEIRHQILPDGLLRERAIGYHRLVAELFIFAQTVGQSAGLPFDAQYRSHTARLRKAVSAYSLANGSYPALGDDDSGRLLCCGDRSLGSHLYLAESLESTAPPDPETFLLTGQCLPPGKPAASSQAFPVAGLYVLRVSGAEVSFRSGPLGPGGAHAHNDQLSFTLTLGGCLMIVDHGTGVYSADPFLRNRFRSTRHHNTVQLCGREQNPLTGGLDHLFVLPDTTHSHVLDLDLDNPDTPWLTAEHYGFQHEPVRRIHRRTVQLSQGRLVITDTFPGTGRMDDLEWNFHLHPSVSVRGAHPVEFHHNDRKVCLLSPPDLEGGLVDCLHSEAYGIIRPCSCLRYAHRHTPASLGQTWCFTFEW